MGEYTRSALPRAILPPIRIGRHLLRSNVFLAPMSGVTDLAFRRIAHDLGAGLVITEMVASEHLVRQRHGARERAVGRNLAPFVIQLAGCEARWMAEGARMAEQLGADIIDINMGCPAREVTGKQAGSALMRDLDHATRLVEAVVGAVGVPVTLEDAHRLGRGQPQRAGLGAARRGGRRGAHHRACAHALPVLQGRGRLGLRARGQGGRARACRRQRRHRRSRDCRGRARGLRRRRRDGRPRCLRCALDAGPHRRLPDERTRSGPSAARRAGRDRAGGTWRPCWPSTARSMVCASPASTSAGTWRAAAARRTPSAAWRRRLCTSENAGEVLDGLGSFYDEAFRPEAGEMAA